MMRGGEGVVAMALFSATATKGRRCESRAQPGLCFFVMTNPTATNWLGATLLAARNNDAAGVEAGIANGVDLGPRWDKRRTMLMIAAANGSADAVAALLPHSNANLADANGETALMLAASHGSARCVKILMAASNLQAKNRGGQDALLYALTGRGAEGSKQKQECLRLLAEKMDVQRPQGPHSWSESALRHAIKGPKSNPDYFDVLGAQCPTSEEAKEAIKRWSVALLPLTNMARQMARQRAELLDAVRDAEGAPGQAPCVEQKRADARRL